MLNNKITLGGVVAAIFRHWESHWGIDNKTTKLFIVCE